MKDPRYDQIKGLLETGAIKKFTDIFFWIPASVVAAGLQTSRTRMQNLVFHPEEFKLKEIYKLAELIGCDKKKLLMMAGMEGRPLDHGQ